MGCRLMHDVSPSHGMMGLRVSDDLRREIYAHCKGTREPISGYIRRLIAADLQP
jgi:hypothetical protein